MKTTKLLTIISATGLLAGGFIVHNSRAADQSAAGQPRRFGDGQLLERAKEKLNLSATQVEQIQAAIKGERENIMSLVTRFREARLELRAAIQSPDATEKSVRAAAAKVAAVEADMAVQRLKLSQEIRPILTAEQLVKFAELQAQLDGLIESGIGRMRDRLAE
jgi:Spy/CpxP family protein refolding chaperone